MFGVITAIVAALLAQCIFYRFFHPLSRYPGPFLASFTNLWKFVTFFRGEHHRVEQRLHDKFGHVVRIGPNSLSFSGLSDFEAIYGFNKYVEKGDFYDFSRDNRQARNIFSARTDASHREHRRKVVGPALSATKVASYEPIISKHVFVLLARLRAQQEECPAFDVTNLIHRHTVNTVIDIIYGEPISPQPYTDSRANASLPAILRDASKWAWGGSLLPWLGWIMSSPFVQSRMRRPTYDSDGNLSNMAALGANTRALIFEHPEVAIKSTQPSIVKNYLSVPEDSPSRMSANQIWGECFNLVFAGPGSTAAALTALIFRLGTAEGRKWQAHIRAEQKSSTGNGTASPPSSAIPPVLLAAIKETLRLDTPFSTAFPRVIAPGAESVIPDLPGPLPAGTIVSAHTFVLGRSTSLWGDDAEVWRPDRWLGPASEAELRELDEKFVSFSKGARGCIGKEIAMLMVAKAIVAVLGEWDVTAVGAIKGKSWLEMQYQECVISFVPLGG